MKKSHLMYPRGIYYVHEDDELLKHHAVPLRTHDKVFFTLFPILGNARLSYVSLLQRRRGTRQAQRGMFYGKTGRVHHAETQGGLGTSFLSFSLSLFLSFSLSLFLSFSLSLFLCLPMSLSHTHTNIHPQHTLILAHTNTHRAKIS